MIETLTTYKGSMPQEELLARTLAVLVNEKGGEFKIDASNYKDFTKDQNLGFRYDPVTESLTVFVSEAKPSARPLPKGVFISGGKKGDT